jgi:hypothetical protein
MNERKWWKRKEVWGGVLTVLSAGLELFAAPHTLGYKAGILIGVGLSVWGFRKGYQADNLPSGISKVMDRIPDKITGVRGSAVK